MKFGWMVVSMVVLAAFTSSCSTSCGHPDVCNTGTAAYAQFTDKELATMTSKLDGLAGISAPQ